MQTSMNECKLLAEKKKKTNKIGAPHGAVRHGDDPGAHRAVLWCSSLHDVILQPHSLGVAGRVRVLEAESNEVHLWSK